MITNMYVCVCMHARAYVCMYVCNMYMCIHVHMYTRTRAHTHTHPILLNKFFTFLFDDIWVQEDDRNLYVFIRGSNKYL